MGAIRTTYQKVVPAGLRRRVSGVRQRLSVRSGWDLVTSARAAAGLGTAVVAVPHGRLAVDLRDRAVGRVLHLDGIFEPAETQFLRSVLRPGMMVYDIGANLDYMTTLSAGLVAPRGQVVAFEPDPYNHSLLVANIARNRSCGVKPLRMALGAEPGTIWLFQSADNYGDHRVYGATDRPSIEVPIDRLDAVVAREGVPPPDLIKMDIQGYETFALKGFGHLLDGPHPLTILTEYWPAGIRAAGGDPADLLTAMARAGLTAFALDEDGRVGGIDLHALDQRLEAAEQADPGNGFANLVFRRGPAI